MVSPTENLEKSVPPKIAALEHQPTREEAVKLPDVTVLTEIEPYKSDPLMHVSLTNLRDARTDNDSFRHHVASLTEKLISAMFSHRLRRKEITTPLDCQFHGFELDTNAVLIGINRASLSMVLAFLRFTKKDIPIGFVDIETDERTLEGTLEGFNLPPDIAGRELIFLHPANGAGGSFERAWQVINKEYFNKGQRVACTKLATIFSSALGIFEVRRTLPGVQFYTVSLDDRLVKRGETSSPAGFVFPGAGDVGFRQYGNGRSGLFVQREEMLSKLGVDIYGKGRHVITSNKDQNGNRVYSNYIL